jgi:hypothetical protein
MKYANLFAGVLSCATVTKLCSYIHYLNYD